MSVPKKRLEDTASDASATGATSDHWTDAVKSCPDGLREKENAKEEKDNFFVSTVASHTKKKKDTQANQDGHQRNHQATARGTRD